MGEKIYFISEAARIVGVEAHVLRYWEEELGLQIQRNRQGKRCYTQEDIKQLETIHYWKDKGMQLKAVREILEGEAWKAFEANASEENDASELPEEDFTEENDESELLEEALAEDGTILSAEGKKKTADCWQKTDGEENNSSCELIALETPSDTMKKFEQILNAMIERTLEQNNEKLVREICDALWCALDEKLEARMDRLVQQELLRELVKEGEAEAAATVSKKKGIWRWWRGKKER